MNQVQGVKLNKISIFLCTYVNWGELSFQFFCDFMTIKDEEDD